jgi:hypothetical protein
LWPADGRGVSLPNVAGMKKREKEKGGKEKSKEEEKFDSLTSGSYLQFNFRYSKYE